MSSPLKANVVRTQVQFIYKVIQISKQTPNKDRLDMNGLDSPTAGNNINTRPGARFNKEVQPTLSLNLNSELSYSEMGNSEFSVTEQLNCVSLLNSK